MLSGSIDRVRNRLRATSLMVSDACLECGMPPKLPVKVPGILAQTGEVFVKMQSDSLYS